MGTKRDSIEASFKVWLCERGIDPERADEMARMTYRGLRGDDDLFVYEEASEFAIMHAMGFAGRLTAH